MKQNVRRRVSRMGLALVGVYAFLTVAAVVTALGAGDVKGDFVFLQLPLALQMGLIVELLPSLSAQLVNVSWPMAYLLIWPPTALVFYAIGSMVGSRRSQR